MYIYISVEPLTHFLRRRPVHPANVYPPWHPALLIPANAGMVAFSPIASDDTTYVTKFWTNEQLSNGLWGYPGDYEAVLASGAQVRL